MAVMRERHVVVCSDLVQSGFNLLVTVVCDDETSDDDAQKIALYKVKRELAKNDNCFGRLKSAVNDSVIKFEDSTTISH